MKRAVSIALLAAGLGCAAVLSITTGGAAPPPAVKAILEVDRDVYYAGDPVPVRISVWNDGGTPVEAPGGDVAAGFELFDVDGKKILPVSGSTMPAAASPGSTSGSGAAAPSGGDVRRLAAGTFFGFARDLTTIYPRLKEAGTYRLQWSLGELVSNAVVLRVIPRYDPDKDYTARLETDAGVISLEFLRKDAPIAVKTFVELAQTGFYDGVVFHYVEPERVIASGDPTGTGRGGPGFQIPHERTQVKMLAGTVIMPAMGRPPSNGSMFAILLAPRPDYEGIETGFAQVIDGLDVARRIAMVPASPGDAPQPHRPLRDVRVNRVVIKPKTP